MTLWSRRLSAHWAMSSRNSAFVSHYLVGFLVMQFALSCPCSCIQPLTYIPINSLVYQVQLWWNCCFGLSLVLILDWVDFSSQLTRESHTKRKWLYKGYEIFSLFLSSVSCCLEVSSSAAPSTPCHDGLSYHRSENMESANHGLSPLKPWAQINILLMLIFSIKLIVLRCVVTVKKRWITQTSSS